MLCWFWHLAAAACSTSPNYILDDQVPSLCFVWYNKNVQPTEETNQSNQSLPTSGVAGAGVIGVPVDDKVSSQISNAQADLSAIPRAQLSTAGQAIAQLQTTPDNAPVPDDTPTRPASPPIVDPPAVADDNDLIEQEWVDKAKAIVERTHDDPHLQNQEMNKFKAEYIKKRYNREIKVTEE